MKKLVHGIFLCAAFFIFPTITLAADTCCTANGGSYYCDFSTSKLYCKDGTVSTQCTCRPADTPTPAPTATPTPTPKVEPTPLPTPVCPAYSTYSLTQNACQCNTGYVVSDSSCVSYAQYCWTNYGGNSLYHSDQKRCVCASGYTWNDNATSCISLNQMCQNKLGNESYYNGDNKTCNCYQGYSIQDNKCKVIPTSIPTPSGQIISPSTSMVVVTNTPIPTPTILKVIPSKRPEPTHKTLQQLGIHFVPVKKPQPNFFEKFFISIWNFFKKFARPEI